MGTPATYSQIAVSSKRDLILINLVTGFSMSLPALNQRKNIVTLSSRFDDVVSNKQGPAMLPTSHNLWKLRTWVSEFTHVMRVGNNFTYNLHKTVSLCQTEGVT